MKYESPSHPSPAIHPNIEAATARLLPSLVRVIVEACPEGTRCYRKLNALDITTSPRDRTSHAEEEINAAIMSMAEVYASETDEPTLYRAKYMCVDEEGDEEKRRYVTFRLAEHDEPVVKRERDGEQPPQWFRDFMAMCTERDRVLIQHNEMLTGQIMTLSSQAVPLLRVQENVSRLFEKAMGMMFQAAVTQGTAIGAQQVLPEAPKEGDSFSEEVLKPGLEMALWQFFNRGKAPPPAGFSGAQGAPPDAASPGASPGAPPGTGTTPPGADTPSSGTKEKVTAEVVEDPIVRTVAMWLGSMDGEQTLEMASKLSAEQTRCLQAVRSAKNDDAAAKAVLAFQAEMVKGGNALDVYELLDPTQKKVLMTIQAMATRLAEPTGK